MKQGNIGHWSDEKKNSNLLIFTQLVNELLFDYSIPSNKISTLNSHYLCYDAMITISTIEENGVPEGTLKPIAEEFYDVLNKDIVFQITEEKPIKYFIKKTSERYIPAKPSDLNYQELKLIISAIHNKFFSNNWYFNTLKTEISKRVKSSDNTEWRDLFKLTKIYLTELVNGGYDARYIYEKLHYYFYSTHTPSDEISIDSFLNTFDFTEHDYKVIIKAPTCVKKVFSFSKKIKPINDIGLSSKSKNGKIFLNKLPKTSFYSLSVKSFDKYRAVALSRRIVERIFSQYKLFDHKLTVDLESLSYAVVKNNFDLDIIDNPKGALLKKGTLPKSRLTDNMNICQKVFSLLSKEGNIHDLHTLSKALLLHSHSLDSDSEENQLLDLWSIFETVLDINNKHTSDRIQQICFLLIPILKRKYLFSLFEQLANDIYLYSEELYKNITGQNKVEKSGIYAICRFVLLDSQKELRERLLQEMNSFPLLKERIIYYNELLSSREKCAFFIEKHLNRIRWQIMRIYRNRNLIIHNGERMPYLGLLIENLHYYVDDFIEYVIESLSKGLTLYNMELDLFVEEQEWMAYFSKKKEVISNEDIDYLLDC